MTSEQFISELIDDLDYEFSINVELADNARYEVDSAYWNDGEF